MEGKNLLIIGGVVALGGYYLVNKNKKEKEKADKLEMLLASQTQANTVAPTPLVTSNLLSDAEAKVYATRTIAQVNSLMAKYPALTKEQFLQEYNASRRTNLILNEKGEFAFPDPLKTLDTISATRRVSYLLDANSRFKDSQVTFSRWKADFATVYKDLKNYYANLTKEKANKVIKFLPKIIIRAMLGDNDSRAGKSDFFTQQETIDMVDSKIDFEKELRDSLRGWGARLQMYESSNNRGGGAVAIPVYRDIENL